jgi:hypothetical protein
MIYRIAFALCGIFFFTGPVASATCDENITTARFVFAKG